MAPLTKTTSPKDVIAVPGSMPAATWSQLEAYLASLPVATAVKLFTALETDRQHTVQSDQPDKDAFTSQGMPYDALMAVLRQRLIEEERMPPARVISARRVFFALFEPFLTPMRKGRKRVGRIARSSLSVIWQFIITHPLGKDAAATAKTFDEALAGHLSTQALSDHQDDLRGKMLIALGEAVSAIVELTNEDTAERQRMTRLFSTQLGGDAAGAGAVLDLAEIAQLVPQAEVFRQLKSEYPKTLSGFSEEAIFDIRRRYTEVCQSDPDIAIYVLVYFAGWLDAPWQAAHLVYAYEGMSDPDVPKLSDDAGVLMETLFVDMESVARALEQDVGFDLETGTAGAAFMWFADFANGLIDAARANGDGVRVNRAEAGRDVAVAALVRTCDQAKACLGAVTPRRPARGAMHLAAWCPDLEAEISVKTIEMAKAAGTFLVGVENISASLQRDVGGALFIADIRKEIEQYTEDVILEIRVGEGKVRERAKVLMAAVLDATKTILPEQTHGVLKARAAAAALAS